ncbi:MAG: sensor histidine kinase [Actinomycetota bacterium]|nr:sensor histidine kinase [Actinomycetota bacterium]
MSALSDLLSEQTDLGSDAAAHLQQLVGDWQILADLAFADLLLWVRTRDGELLCVGHVRPTTAPTSHPLHEVGRRVAAGELSWLDRALDAGGMIRDRDPEWGNGIPIRPEAIAVRHGGKSVAVLGRDTNLDSLRTPSELELAYLDAAAELFYMVTEGSFPAVVEGSSDSLGPRVGDGFARLDTGGVVRYASPNGLSAFRRMGLTADLVGRDLADIGRDLIDAADGGDRSAVEPGDISALRLALAAAVPHTGELAAGSVTVAYRIIPLSRRASSHGCVVLLRDMTDLRHRDLALQSKDVSIREIHHRVKNNLQTVAALLRLQARRMHHPAARAALAESVQRVSSIALVHETLAASRDGAADLDGILDSLIPMISDVSAARPGVAIRRKGHLGELSAELATPLVMVLTELLHNAVEHGYSDRDRGQVLITAERTIGTLTVRISDDGRGLPQGFSLEASDSLGLQIVRTLVESEMRGSIRLVRRRSAPGLAARPDSAGTEAVLTVPLPR